MASFSRLFGLKVFRGAPLNVIRNLCVQQQNVNKQLLVTGINAVKPVWLHEKQNNLNLPTSTTTYVDLPSGLIWMPSIEDPRNNLIEIGEAPTGNVDNSKQAARLIVIRRKKMRKHKLKKLRKRMKFINAKRRQKRESRKEKEFQAELIQQCKVAESFSAEEYVNQKLQKYKEAQEFLSERKNIQDSTYFKTT